MAARIKDLLKRLLPVKLRKILFLKYNTFRIRTIDKLLFPEKKIPIETFQIYLTGNPFNIYHITFTHLNDELVRKYMQYWVNWSQEEFILIDYVGGYIEPQCGWLITKNNKLNYYSLGVSRALHQQKPALKTLFRKLPVSKYESIISLRDTGEENYFHFYNDVLAKIFFLQNNDIDVYSLPILISVRLYNKPYFQFYIRHHPALKEINWIIQDNDFIQADQVIFCKPLTHSLPLLSKVILPIMTVMKDKAATNILHKRVFISRSKLRLRYIDNIIEIEKICAAFGLYVVDLDALSMEEQIGLFSNAELIAGIHGAGLTNMIYRMGKPCTVLEIFPPPNVPYLPFHYILLARQLNFDYQAIIGSESKVLLGSGFYLDPENFEACLAKLF